MSRIPEEIIYTEILPRLPVKSLLKFKCVSKKWYDLISTSDFVKLHLHCTTRTKKPILILEIETSNDDESEFYSVGGFYSIGYDSLESTVSEIEPAAVEIDFPFNSTLNYDVLLVGSCYGLVCLLVTEIDVENDGDRKFLCLWNPATREYKKIPQQPIGNNGMSAIYALGYDHKTDDYKLAVGVTTPRSKDIVFQFYSLASNSWKSGPTMPYVFRYCVQRHGVLVNGFHHWLVKAQCKFILSLDISDETFKEMQLLKELSKSQEDFNFMILGLLEGCLCILDTSDVDGVQINVEVWEMLEYGVHESWTRRYIITNKSITKGHILDLVALWSFENGKILFMDSGLLVLYDPENGSARKLNNDESFNRTTGNYFESLVSLDSGTYVGGEEQIEELEQPEEEEE